MVDCFGPYMLMALLGFLFVFIFILRAVCTMVLICIYILEILGLCCYFLLWLRLFWGMFFLEGRCLFGGQLSLLIFCLQFLMLVRC